jgi:hypothetical protein
MDHGSAYPSPLICVIRTEDDEIDWNADIAEGFTESNELRAAAFQVRLDDEQIEITVGTTLAPSARAEKDHRGVGGCCRETATRLDNQGLVSHYLDRSRRGAGKLRLSTPGRYFCPTISPAHQRGLNLSPWLTTSASGRSVAEAAVSSASRTS